VFAVAEDVEFAAAIRHIAGNLGGDIRFDVGFGNLSNFNRQFLAQMGITLSEYRGEGKKVSVAGIAGVAQGDGHR
jgi:hypothetical protein